MCATNLRTRRFVVRCVFQGLNWQPGPRQLSATHAPAEMGPTTSLVKTE
jgi:hypothetical protein